MTAHANLASIGYDGLGRRTSLTMGPGSTSSTAGYGYDPIGRLASLSHDLAGSYGDVTQTFAYNPASQIASETRDNDAYAWTAHYNVSRGYVTNGLNQYLGATSAAGTTGFGYDANGNLTSYGSTSFVYDAENRLVQASGGTTASLAYDPLGRLWQVSGGTSGTTRFLYDGDRLTMEYDGSGNVLRSYVHGPDPDAPLVWYEANAGRRFLHADERGSIVAVADDNGTALSLNSYDDYGIPGATNLGRFQYTGQAWLPELGLYYYKARLYSPTIGRFLQTDPIGYQDQINLYAYVNDDPVNGVDPSGTTCQKSGDGAYTCQIDKVQTTVNGKEVTRNATAADHKQYAGVEKSLTNAVNAAAAKGGKMENISFKAGEKSYSFSISSGQIAQNLAARTMVAEPGGIVGAMNTPSNRITNIESKGINPGGYTKYGNASRTRSMEFLHEGIHGGREEARGSGSDLRMLGVNPFKDAHQDSYDDAADDILGPQ